MDGRSFNFNQGSSHEPRHASDFSTPKYCYWWHKNGNRLMHLSIPKLNHWHFNQYCRTSIQIRTHQLTHGEVIYMRTMWNNTVLSLTMKSKHQIEVPMTLTLWCKSSLSPALILWGRIKPQMHTANLNWTWSSFWSSHSIYKFD